VNIYTVHYALPLMHYWLETTATRPVAKCNRKIYIVIYFKELEKMLSKDTHLVQFSWRSDQFFHRCEWNFGQCPLRPAKKALQPTSPPRLRL